MIYHTIKGQTEYEEEYGIYKQYFDEKNIPVYKVTTDYNYLDYSDIRIELQEFAQCIMSEDMPNKSIYCM